MGSSTGWDWLLMGVAAAGPARLLPYRIPMRYLAIDLGDKRTGIAVGDSITGLVSPIDVLEVPIAGAGGAVLLNAIARVVEEHLGPPPPPGRIGNPGELVVGLPLNMDGTEGQRSRLVREFAARIGQHTQRSVHLHDERLTSAAADWSMARSGLTHKQKKERRDALAAAAVLQDFLTALAAGGSSAPAAGNRIESGES
jgi:putative holliday junction resolvase